MGISVEGRRVPQFQRLEPSDFRGFADAAEAVPSWRALAPPLYLQNKKGAPARAGAPRDFNPGSDLRSHAVASAVSSARGRSACAKLFQGEAGILENPQEQTFGDVAAMRGHNQHGSLGMFEDDMRAALADFLVAMLF